MQAMLDTGANISVIDDSLVKKRKWDVKTKKIELKLASQENHSAQGILEKPGWLMMGKTSIPIKPVVMKLNNPDYKLIIGNVDMMHMGITLQNLPSPVSLRDDSALVDNEMFSTASPVDTKEIHEASQELEELLNLNKKIPLENWCTLDNAVVRLQLRDQDVKDSLRKLVYPGQRSGQIAITRSRRESGEISYAKLRSFSTRTSCLRYRKRMALSWSHI